VTSRAHPASRRLPAPALVGFHLALLVAIACQRPTATVASTVAEAPEPAGLTTEGTGQRATAAADTTAAPDATAASAARGGPSADRSVSDAAPALTELIVGSESGLQAYGVDGARRRIISPGAALHPRWFNSENVIVLAPRDPRSLSAGATLQRVSLADGRRHDLAVLPPFGCEPRATEPDDTSFRYELDLQDDGDFDLAPAAGLACLRLLDRNVNMASVVLDVRIDLRTGRVERWLAVGEDVCTPPPGVPLGSATSECRGDAEPPAVSPTPARVYSYDMPDADGRVIETTPQGARTALQLGLDYSPEDRSPSGRWLVLGGDTEEGDYLYRRLSLLDRERGRVYPIIPGAAWPAAIEAGRGSPPTLPLPIEGAVLVSGETDVRWLETPNAELLVVGNAIIRPGAKSFTVDGTVAR
jgi:hypothetical protein